MGNRDLARRRRVGLARCWRRRDQRRPFRVRSPSFLLLIPSFSHSFLPSPTPPPACSGSRLDKRWLILTLHTQCAPRHLVTLPAEAQSQGQSVSIFAGRPRPARLLVRQSPAANLLQTYLSVSAAWYIIHGNRTLPIADFYVSTEAQPHAPASTTGGSRVQRPPGYFTSATVDACEFREARRDTVCTLRQTNVRSARMGGHG